ncbi:MAG: Dabb family protein [Geminicoccaceae bacterium]
MIRHIVFFSARDPADLPVIEAGLKRLETIGAADRLEVRRNLGRDDLGNTVDLVVYGEFADAAALAAYKADPLYAEAIAIVRPLRELRVAADVETEAVAPRLE